MKTLIIIFLFSVIIFAQSPSVNGIQWNQSTSIEKNTYIGGILDGIYVAGAFNDFQHFGDNAYCTRVNKAIRYYNNKFFVGHTIDDIRLDIDTFYSNYKNLNIEVDNAIWIVEYYNSGEYKNHKLSKDNSKGDDGYYERLLNQMRKMADNNQK